jgi:hypothetical protein
MRLCFYWLEELSNPDHLISLLANSSMDLEIEFAKEFYVGGQEIGMIIKFYYLLKDGEIHIDVEQTVGVNSIDMILEGYEV